MGISLRQAAARGLKVGDRFRIRRTFSEEETRAFGELTRDYNPVHYDTAWCDAKGFRDRICHGLLVGSMICEFGGQVGWLASAMSFRFLRPVYFGEALCCTITITHLAADGRAEAEAEWTNAAGERLLTAQMKGRLPRGQERELLQRWIEAGEPQNPLRGRASED